MHPPQKKRNRFQSLKKELGLDREYRDWIENPENIPSVRPSWISRIEKQYNKQRRVDPALLFVVILLFISGSLMLFSSSMITGLYARGSSGFFIFRQVIFLILGFGVMFFFIHLDPAQLNHKIWITLSSGVSFVLLILVLIPGIGHVIQGARRWLPLPFIGLFQPSEFTKVSVILYLAWYYSRLQRRKKRGLWPRAKNPRNQVWVDTAQEVIFPMIPVVLQLALISLQAHMSAVVIITLVCIFIMAAAGVHWKSWLRGFLVGGGALAILVVFFLALSAVFPQAHFSQRWKHVGTRLNIFTDSDSVTREQRMQSDQALIAIGSGGVTGVGLGQSRQKYQYLPENHNDYIYSILCEETGFIGGSLVILLFAIYLYYGLKVSFRAQTLFGRVVACGFTYLLSLQAYLSIGVNLGILPPTGISMPFFSYGGTSNIIFLAAAGLLLSVSKYDSAEQKWVALDSTPERKAFS